MKKTNKMWQKWKKNYILYSIIILCIIVTTYFIIDTMQYRDRCNSYWVVQWNKAAMKGYIVGAIPNNFNITYTPTQILEVKNES